jgi:hypothetical protein
MPAACLAHLIVLNMIIITIFSTYAPQTIQTAKPDSCSLLSLSKENKNFAFVSILDVSIICAPRLLMYRHQHR